MHAVEKILARAAGKESVKTGEIVNCTVDLAGINDLYLQTVRSFFEMGGTRVRDPARIIMFLDHYAPASTIAQADNQKQFREFCRDQNITELMDVDQGPSPIWYGSRYIKPAHFWLLGAVFGAIFLTVFLLVGVPWINLIRG